MARKLISWRRWMDDRVGSFIAGQRGADHFDAAHAVPTVWLYALPDGEVRGIRPVCREQGLFDLGQYRHVYGYGRAPAGAAAGCDALRRQEPWRRAGGAAQALLQRERLPRLQGCRFVPRDHAGGAGVHREGGHRLCRRDAAAGGEESRAVRVLVRAGGVAPRYPHVVFAGGGRQRRRAARRGAAMRQ